MNLIKHERLDIDFESKYQLLINGREEVGTENVKNPKTFVDYSQTIDDVYENLELYNPTNKRRVLMVFDDMIADMDYNGKLSSIVTKLSLRGRNSILHLFFISQSCLKMKIPNKIDL